MLANEISIEAGRAEANYWRDLWTYRELFYFLAWRDVLVRYKQTVIGIAWALIRPFLTMVILTIVFNKVAKLDAPGTTPYPLMVYAAMLPWQFFATGMSEASTSLITNANMVSKVYFPRLIVPGGVIISSMVDFGVMFLLMGAMMLWYGYAPDWHVLAMPVFLVLVFALAMGFGVGLSALNVKYRDFRYVVPFLIQFGVYISPVGFSTSNVPHEWRFLYSLNPLVGVIDGFRWALLRGETPIWWPSIASSIVVTLLSCAVGAWYFRRTERSFADVI